MASLPKMNLRRLVVVALLPVIALAAEPNPWQKLNAFHPENLRRAAVDFGASDSLLAELSGFEQQVARATRAKASGKPWPDARLRELLQAMIRFKRSLLLSNPLLQDLEILCVKRRWSKRVQPNNLRGLGFTSNDECKISIAREGWDNEIGSFRPAHQRRPGIPSTAPPTAAGWATSTCTGTLTSSC